MRNAVIKLMLLVVLCGCYSQKKATVQHSKAVTAYPAIGADYCARIYPVKNNYIKGDSVVIYDTLFGDGAMVYETIYDTIIIRDTMFITKTIRLPGNTITKTIVRIDTLRVIDKAALDLCSIERGKALDMAAYNRVEADKWKAIAKKRILIIFALAGLLLGALFWIFRRKK